MENIILVGFSLGTAVAIKLASSSYKICGVIAINAFTSIRTITKNLVGGFIAKFIPNIFRSIDYVDKVKCPILYIHGSQDSLVSYEQSQRLFDETKSPKRFTIIPNMTHNQIFIDLVFEVIGVFLRTEMDLSKYLDRSNYKDKSFKEDIQMIRTSFKDSIIDLDGNDNYYIYESLNKNLISSYFELEHIKTCEK